MSKFNFQKVIDNITQVKRELPMLLANDAQKYYLDAFKSQGWNGSQWAEVERRKPDTNAYKYPAKKGLSRRTKPILQGTGRLRREVSLVAGNARIRYERYNFRVTLTLDNNMVPYAKYNNDGTKNIPQRKFMGDSPQLRTILYNRINKYMDNVWKA
ncbi:hypothetical protein [Mucilaginibacter sp. 10I4]|uniref:hypothetical protein n=1 Tax=Mucilaginibacter sp. 10I4 TaxID=3048580 RepID=UPI002B229A98|nr:hypothetical protein [Mucilaginibacter sp. 10I4]MEB0262920.1 hypothetical protein [Mucilaginibacter sp. 10I4]